MDALFVIVAELLLVPLVLWGLIALELTLGLVASLVSILLGRKSLTEALDQRWRAVRRRLRWSLIFMSAGLLAVDLLFFDAVVGLALGSVNEREDLDVEYRSAEGSFILGRVEIDGLILRGRRGEADDPRADYELSIDELVIDIDTAKLLALDFAVEEIAVDGARGRWDRLRGADAKQEPAAERGFELGRDFAVERMHFGDLVMELRDHTRTDDQGNPRAVGLTLNELDLGPLHSDSAAFDLLYRARGRGEIGGLPFELTAIEVDGTPQSTLELRDLPLDALSGSIERRTGIRTGGRADLTMVDRYRPAKGDGTGGPAGVELTVSLQLRGLELEAGEDASWTTKKMLGGLTDALTSLGADFPLHFTLEIGADELAGVRSIAESGLAERIGQALLDALQAELKAHATTN